MLPKILRLSQLRLTQDVRRIAAFALAAVSLAGFTPSVLTAQQAASQLVTNRLTQPVDDSARITLKGTVHPLANKANDRGAAPDSMPLDRIQVVLKRSNAQEAALKQLITDLHTPKSASYHKWLTPDQFGAQFGPSDQDIATVEAWLQSKGFNVTKVNPGKQTIEMSGNAGQFRAAFGAQIHKYSVNGETHYSNASDPQIPAALAPVFGGFASLNNFRPKRQSHVLGRATYDPKTDKATPQWTYGNSSGVSFVLSPADFGVQYDLPNSALNSTYTGSTSYTGAGQTIAIINDSNINIDLVNQYRTLFSLPANPPQVIIDGNDPGVDGINNPDGPNYDSSEAYLDVEESGAVAPNATIDLVIGADTALESGLALALEHAIYGNVAPVLSISFGFGCESALGSSGNTFFNALWEQAAAQGITAIVSAGDNGSAGCDSDTSEYATGGLGVSGLASTPYNVAVGGTDFYYTDYATGAASAANYWNTTPSQTPTASIKGVIPEQPWNNSQYGFNVINYYTDISGSTATTVTGGSGGSSITYTKPSWQTGFGDTSRDIPDVSLFAANGQNFSYYPVCAVDGDCQAPSGSDLVQFTGIGGTSASAPAFAGIMALVNQKYGMQGQADFVLYPLAANPNYSQLVFHDVTVGTNAQPCPYSTTTSSNSLDCIAGTALKPYSLLNSSGSTVSVEEGELGTGSTPGYNAGAGYDLASGLGSLDVNQLITNWGNVTFASTTTTLTPSSTSFTHGTPITVSGSVTLPNGTPSGNVALMTDSTEPIQQGQTIFPLTPAASDSTFSGSISTLPGGTYDIWGQYSGDGTNGASTSQKTSITVSPENSGIYFNVFTPAGTLTASSNPTIDYGTQLELSAQVAPSSDLTALATCETNSTTCPSFTTPTGTVTFSDSSTTLNTAVLNAEGDAEFNAPLAVGSHTVSAKYVGDNSYNASSSSTIAFTVGKDTPVLGLGASNQVSSTQYLSGQATVFNIEVANNAAVSYANPSNNIFYPSQIAAPTGTVTVSGFPSGTSAVSSLVPVVDPGYEAVASIATVTAPAGTATGTYNLTINYSGDGNYNSTSGQTSISIVSTSGLATTTTATTSGSISPNSSITIMGTVTGQSGHAAPTGDIFIYSSGYAFNQEYPLVAGSSDSSTFTITLNSQTLFQGNNVITLQYTGDNTYAPSAFQLTSPISNPLSDFSLIPESPSLGFSTSSGAGVLSDVINLSSVNGFSGNVNLSCSGTGAVGCALSSSTVSLASGGSASVTLTINDNVTTASSYNVLVTASDAATGEFVHTIGIPVTAAVLSAGLTLVGPSSITIQNPGDTATGTLVVAPQGGLSGGITPSCTIENSPAGISCSASASAATGIISTLTITTTSAATAGNYTAQIIASQGSVTSNTLSIPITLNPNAAIALTSSGAITVAPGATTSNTSTITVTPTNFTGTVNLTCSLTTSPSGATDVPTCTIPGTVSITSASTPATATLTVNTTAATSGALRRPLDKFFAVGGGIAIAGLLLFGIPARRRSWRTILGVLVFAALVGAGIGCGGGGSSGGGGGGGGSTGTTAGAYVVTVTGTDAATGKITGSIAVNVTVN